MDIKGGVRRLKVFFEESYNEMKKVSWPPKKDTLRAAYAVISFVIILAFFLGIIDFILAKITNWIVG
ncbi:MAG: preprotein translocase subunit SecE [Proteobacteria bacterium]|nr:preprotein translocase subunit SecE [Pseudomonadota bacterium]